MKKPIYKEEDERLTDEATSLDMEAYQALEPIFNKWIRHGFKIREIQYLIQHVCLDISLNKLLFPIDSKENKP
jgi:hypothetical protein